MIGFSFPTKTNIQTESENTISGVQPLLPMNIDVNAPTPWFTVDMVNLR